MPCDYSKYPANWKEIRARILDRDGHRCRFCLVPNGAFRNHKTESYIIPPNVHAREDLGPEFSQIVLTIAHLNHDINDNRDINLAALCQRCHNRLDAPHRADNRRRKREAKP